MRKLMILAAIGLLASPAMAQKAIYTGGPSGAYHNTFCPPIPGVLEQEYFSGYKCSTSGGTVDNIAKVMAAPTSIGFVQLDVYAGRALADPKIGEQTAVIRQDIACEGLWMVTKNPRLQSFGDVQALAQRIPFILPGEASGSTASFKFLQTIDPKLKLAQNFQQVKDATTVIETVKNGPTNGGPVGFFVQFADPENANIRLMMESGLTVLPVLSREILAAKVADKEVYQAQSFQLTGAGYFRDGKAQVTTCTPVAIITGKPGFGDATAQVNQKNMIETVASINSTRLLPQESRVAKLLASARRLSTAAMDEAIAGVEKARAAAERMAQ
jgi:hypothetical protein